MRLRAEQIEDVTVIGTCLQGAMCCYGEMAFDSDHLRFAAIMVRYTWEDAAIKESSPMPLLLRQARTALRIEFVDEARIRGIDLKEENKLLELVTVSAREFRGKVQVNLIFSCGGEICLDVTELDVRMEDLDIPVESHVKVSFVNDES